MAKNALFRRELFGFSKADVNQYIAAQNERLRELSASLDALEKKFDAHRVFYETLLRVHDDNLAVLREVQTRAGRNENTVRALTDVFNSLSVSYRNLYELAYQQQQALTVAKLYEDKAGKYDELSRRMKEMVLPASMQEMIPPLAPLPEVETLPSPKELDDLTVRASEALNEMLSDARAFFGAGLRLQTPGRPDETNSSVG